MDKSDKGNGKKYTASYQCPNQPTGTIYVTIWNKPKQPRSTILIQAEKCNMQMNIDFLNTQIPELFEEVLKQKTFSIVDNSNGKGGKCVHNELLKQCGTCDVECSMEKNMGEQTTSVHGAEKNNCNFSETDIDANEKLNDFVLEQHTKPEKCAQNPFPELCVVSNAETIREIDLSEHIGSTHETPLDKKEKENEHVHDEGDEEVVDEILELEELVVVEKQDELDPLADIENMTEHCQECDVAYPSGTALNEHIAVAHKSKVINCHLCEEVFHKDEELKNIHK